MKIIFIFFLCFSWSLVHSQQIDFIIGDILPSHATAVELNVNRDNPAISFYKKLGFGIKREEDIDIGEGFFMNDYVLSLQLPLLKGTERHSIK